MQHLCQQLGAGPKRFFQGRVLAGVARYLTRLESTLPTSWNKALWETWWGLYGSRHYGG